VLNGRLLTYDLKVDKVVSNRVRWWGYEDTQCLSVVVYNLIACLRKGNKLVYSRDVGGKKVKSKKGITARRVIKAMNFLEKEGYIINNIGVSSKEQDERCISWAIPTQKFLDEWGFDETIQLKAEINYLEQCEVIELRDETKARTPYRSSDHVTRMSETVRRLNQMNESCEVRDGSGQVLTNIYCRIFNESFDLGGRFYRADVLAIKNKNTNDRLRITIDGCAVCEVDYSNLHFRIAAALEDIDTEEIPLDVYSGVLEDEDNLVDRGIVKLAVNMMFNCKSEASARGAIQKVISKMSDSDRQRYTLGNARSVMALVYSAYPDFSHLFCENESFGRRLQNEDSHLASDIIEVMLENKVPCLPVHDSFIVPVDSLNLLCDTMGNCFRNRFGWEGVVPVGLKYLSGSGGVVEEKMCV